MRRLADVDAFLAAAGTFVARDEARHALVRAVTDTLLTRPELASRRPYLGAVECSGEVVGAAVMLPPNPLVISPLTPADALPAVVADLLDDGRVEQVTQTSGVPAVVEPFLSLWRARTGRVLVPVMRERLHRIDAAPPVPDVPGRFRLAVAGDVELLVEWSVAFEAEAWGGAMRVERDVLRINVAARVEGRGGSVGLWVDASGEPVAMAAYFSGGPPGAARIAPVYTPPSLRGRGYGTAVTAALTRLAFERGHAFCMLFTDLANPVSNRIYANIGYVPVADWVHAKRVDG